MFWNLYVFQVNNKESRMTLIDISILVVFFSLTLKNFRTLFWCFHCWLATSNFLLGRATKLAITDGNGIGPTNPFTNFGYGSTIKYLHRIFRKTFLTSHLPPFPRYATCTYQVVRNQSKPVQSRDILLKKTSSIF